MKKIITLIVLFCGLLLQAQAPKNVEYIQLKRMYEFQEEPNQYRLSSMLKYQFENLGYKVYYKEDGIPDEVKKDPCKSLVCVVEKSGRMTATELTVHLVDCKSNVIVSGTGISREKKRSITYRDVVNQIFEKSAIQYLKRG